jgi:hypothetical protein
MSEICYVKKKSISGSRSYPRRKIRKCIYDFPGGQIHSRIAGILQSLEGKSERKTN